MVQGLKVAQTNLQKKQMAQDDAEKIARDTVKHEKELANLRRENEAFQSQTKKLLDAKDKQIGELNKSMNSQAEATDQLRVSLQEANSASSDLEKKLNALSDEKAAIQKDLDKALAAMKEAATREMSTVDKIQSDLGTAKTYAQALQSEKNPCPRN